MTAAPHATASTTAIEAWLSHLRFAELVVEVRHCGGSTLQGVVVRRVAACTFTLGDGVGGDSWSGDHRAQSKNHGDCAGEHQSSRWDLSGCHNHTPSSSRRPRRAATTRDSRASGPRRDFRGKSVNAHSLWVAWTIDANSLGGRRQPVSVRHLAPESGTTKAFFAGSLPPATQAGAPCQPNCCVRTMLVSISCPSARRNT